MRKKNDYFEDIWEERKEAIKRTDEQVFEEFKERMKKGKLPEQPKSKMGVVFLLIFIVLLSAVLLVLLYSALQPDTKIIYKTTEKVVREQPIVNQEKIVNNITNYLQPENTANCIKVQAEGSDRYSMQCRIVNKT